MRANRMILITSAVMLIELCVLGIPSSAAANHAMIASPTVMTTHSPPAQIASREFTIAKNATDFRLIPSMSRSTAPTNAAAADPMNKAKDPKLINPFHQLSFKKNSNTAPTIVASGSSKSFAGDHPLRI